MTITFTTAQTARCPVTASSTTPSHVTTSTARASARTPGKVSRATLMLTNARKTQESAGTLLSGASTQKGVTSVCALTPLCLTRRAEHALVSDASQVLGQILDIQVTPNNRVCWPEEGGATPTNSPGRRIKAVGKKKKN